MRTRSLEKVLFLALAVTIAGCDDDKKERLLAQTAGEAGAIPTATATTLPSATAPSATASASSSSAPDAGSEAKRFDPKYKCPTGQTHFYLEGDFCRRKCFTNGDCGKKEHCSAIDYPFILDGGTAGMSKFCEGT